MCKKPRSPAKRRAWLNRWLRVLRGRLADGFSEAWYGGVDTSRRRRRHYTVADQIEACMAKIAQAEVELTKLAG